MSLYRVSPYKLEVVPRTTFSAENLLERKDLQRFLRKDISPIGDDLLVIAEEYGDWEESNRRIDLLCITSDASLAVIEIKRTEDGGHMELQAIRYASMVSSMTMEQVIQTYARTHGAEIENAKKEILAFIETSAYTDELSGDVRIILVSANFSPEVTTAVLWLNKRDLDITCFRLIPHRNGEDILVDVTQIIPLPEAADYEIKARAQEKEKRKAKGQTTQIYHIFWTQVIERSKARTDLLATRAASDRKYFVGHRSSNIEFLLYLNPDVCGVGCYIKGGEEKSARAFNLLKAQHEQIEKAFGGTLEWSPKEGKAHCRIDCHLLGGYKSPESEWSTIQDNMIDALIRLDEALRKPLQALVL